MNEQSLPSGKRLKWLGIAMLILGFIAVMAPAVAGTWVVYIIGAVLLVTGITQIYSGSRAEGWSAKVVPLILGVITTLAGIGVLGNPILGLGTLTLLLVIFFVAEGIWKIIASLRYRPAEGWFWLLASGAISLVLGLMIWNQWPVSGLWAVGILVGVNLITTGVSLIVLASAIKQLTRQTK
ncbi:MAG: DUF308 domain-containing protein [Gammaproteobacteria bacterium]|jgi:uncharacterized membrane protein HdeD (DUF308 family)